VLLVAKSIAYSTSLSAFRGGPIFPAMFIGGAIGVAGSHLPGLVLVPAVAMGIGAMTTVMLRLPLTATLLAVLLVSSDALAVTPLVIVAVVVAYVLTARLPQRPAELRGHRAPPTKLTTPTTPTTPATPGTPAAPAGAG
jgi:H+/Cl- antiporter ClcA